MNKKTTDHGTDPVNFDALPEEETTSTSVEENANYICNETEVTNGNIDCKCNDSQLLTSEANLLKTEQSTETCANSVNNGNILDSIVLDR